MLTGRIEQTQRVRVVADHDRHSVVIEHLCRAAQGWRALGSDRKQRALTVGTYSLGNLLVV